MATSIRTFRPYNSSGLMRTVHHPQYSAPCFICQPTKYNRCAGSWLIFFSPFCVCVMGLLYTLNDDGGAHSLPASPVFLQCSTSAMARRFRFIFERNAQRRSSLFYRSSRPLPSTIPPYPATHEPLAHALSLIHEDDSQSSLSCPQTPSAASSTTGRPKPNTRVQRRSSRYLHSSGNARSNRKPRPSLVASLRADLEAAFDQIALNAQLSPTTVDPTAPFNTDLHPTLTEARTSVTLRSSMTDSSGCSTLKDLASTPYRQTSSAKPHPHAFSGHFPYRFPPAVPAQNTSQSCSSLHRSRSVSGQSDQSDAPISRRTRSIAYVTTAHKASYSTATLQYIDLSPSSKSLSLRRNYAPPGLKPLLLRPQGAIIPAISIPNRPSSTSHSSEAAPEEEGKSSWKAPRPGPRPGAGLLSDHLNVPDHRGGDDASGGLQEYLDSATPSPGSEALATTARTWKNQPRFSCADSLRRPHKTSSDQHLSAEQRPASTRRGSVGSTASAAAHSLVGRLVRRSSVLSYLSTRSEPIERPAPIPRPIELEDDPFAPAPLTPRTVAPPSPSLGPYAAGSLTVASSPTLPRFNLNNPLLSPLFAAAGDKADTTSLSGVPLRGTPEPQLHRSMHSELASSGPPSLRAQHSFASLASHTGSACALQTTRSAQARASRLPNDFLNKKPLPALPYEVIPRADSTSNSTFVDYLPILDQHRCHRPSPLSGSSPSIGSSPTTPSATKNSWKRLAARALFVVDRAAKTLTSLADTDGEADTSRPRGSTVEELSSFRYETVSERLTKLRRIEEEEEDLLHNERHRRRRQCAARAAPAVSMKQEEEEGQGRSTSTSSRGAVLARLGTSTMSRLRRRPSNTAAAAATATATATAVPASPSMLSFIHLAPHVNMPSPTTHRPTLHRIEAPSCILGGPASPAPTAQMKACHCCCCGRQCCQR
ncbi:hypothetical protein V8E36_002471 [Tilletia maclaganii]